MTLWRIVCVFGMIACEGCASGAYDTLDRDQDEDFTRQRLHALIEVVRCVVLAGGDIERGIELPELIETAKKNPGCVFLFDTMNDHSHDWWKSPIVVSSDCTTGPTVVSLLSTGRNKLFENGAGDDLVLKLDVTNNCWWDDSGPLVSGRWQGIFHLDGVSDVDADNLREKDGPFPEVEMRGESEEKQGWE